MSESNNNKRSIIVSTSLILFGTVTFYICAVSILFGISIVTYPDNNGYTGCPGNRTSCDPNERSLCYYDDMSLCFILGIPFTLFLEFFLVIVTFVIIAIVSIVRYIIPDSCYEIEDNSRELQIV
jgi:hypothetical protein